MGRYDDPKWHAQTEEAPAPVSRYANPKFYKRDPSTLELIGNASAKGVAGLLDSLGNAPTNLANLGIMAVGAPMVALGKPQWAPDTLPTPDLARRALMGMGSIHPDAEPTTDEQRLLDSVVQGAVGGLFSPAKGGAQILSNLGLGTLSGGAADLATSATGSPVAGLAAAMLTPMGAAGAATLGRKLVPNAQASAGKKLIKAADDPEALRRALARTDHEIVPGSQPTTAEVAMQPGISQAQRSAISMNYGPLTDRAAQQNAARVAQLERIAPGATKVTPIEAADNAGGVVFKLADKNRQAFKDARGAAYHSPVLDSAFLTLPTGAGARAAIETFYPGVSFETAPADLRRLASLMDAGGQVPLKEFDALRKQAGNRAADLADSDRTASAAWSKVKGLFDDAEAAAIARSGEKFAVTGNGPWGPEFGNLAGDPENAVAHLLRMGEGSVPKAGNHPFYGPIELAAGQPIKAGGSGVLHVDAHGRDEALRRIPSLMSEGTWYGRVEGRKLKPKGGDPGQSFLSDGEYEAVLKDHVNLPTNGAARRKWIPTVYPLNPKMMIPLETGQSARAPGITHSALPSNGTNGLTSSIDDALTGWLSDAAAARNPPPPAPPPRNPRQYVGGLLAPDQADMLAQGRDLHGELMGRYHSGPARDLWRDNPDARPVAEGGEIPKVFFRPSADQSARIDAFSNLFPGVSDAVPAFEALRKYAIADLYGHGAGQNGHLKPEGFGNWIDARGGTAGGGAIGGLFSREQRGLLGDVNADIRRSVDANNLGRATGSNTAQNLFSAGALLDNPITDFAIGRLFGGWGGIGRGALGAMLDASRKKAVEQMGPALLDPATARAAIEAADKNTLYRLLADRLPQARNRAALQGLLHQNEDE